MTLHLKHLAPLAFSLLAPTAFSETPTQTPTEPEALEEIFVIGELRKASVMDIANSISVLNEVSIEKRNAHNIEDLLNLAPNVNFSTGASRGRFIQIRGIGERSQFVAPINPSVGVMVDGIDFTGISTAVATLDTQQVEVYRGPQGTLFGANALAGMIYVVGKSPGDELSRKISVGAGTYNTRNLSAVINSPLGEYVGWRFGVQKNKSDGYYENAYLDKKNTNNIDEFSIRNHLAFLLGEQFELDIISYYLDADNGYDAFSLDNNRTTLSDEPGHDRQKSFANAIHLDYSGFGFADLQTVLSHVSSDTEYGYDEDWSYRNICAADSDCAYYQYSTKDNYERDNTNTALDLRLVSNSDEQFFTWVAGAYLKKQDIDLIRTYTNNFPNEDIYTPADPDVSPPFFSNYSTTNAALYGEMNFAFTEALNLVSGLRYERLTSDYYDSNTFDSSPSENFWGGKIALEYSLTENSLAYILASRGYKAGGFNPDADIDESNRLFDSETMNNYELGLKGNWFDQALTLKSALFYQQRKDVQIKTSLAIPLGDNTGFEFQDYLTNAAEGKNYGLEFESHFQATEAIEFFATLGVLKTEFIDFINYSHVDRDASTGEGVDMNGHAQPHAPELQWLAGAEWDIIENLSFRFEYERKSEFYFSANHEEQSEAYGLINMRLNYEFDTMSLALWGKNLSNELVETRGFYFSHDYGNDPRKFYAPEPYTQKGAPRTVGISAIFDF